MNFANYARKSVYADNSDSTRNQSRMCKEYANMHFKDKVDSFNVYEDEDHTGANTNRPELQRMMKDIEDGLYDFLVVYQLDRLSRDVRDFSNIYAFLEEHNVKFISVKENIDTSTPIGRAMMYVSVVFAQMERETIANRVYDNMIGLSSEGWWVGGNPPIGYRRERVQAENGKNHVTIVEVPEQSTVVKDIFHCFLDNKFSLQQMESHFKRNGILTINGKFFSAPQFHKMLTMPYCVPATGEVYDYYKDKGCIMPANQPREMWDGEYGVMIYGRTTERNKKHVPQSADKWRVCIGKHKPFMDVETWLAAQKQFKHNTFNKKMVHDTTLLKGVLRCPCGRLMALGRKKKVDGSVSTWYYCPRRMRQGIEYCSQGHTKADLLDGKVMDIFEVIARDPDEIKKYMSDYSKTPAGTAKEIKKAKQKITMLEKSIENLTIALAAGKESTATKYIITEIEKTDSEISLLTRRIAGLQADERNAANMEEAATLKQKEIRDFIADFEQFSPDERNAIATAFLKSCMWDGEKLLLTL